MRGYQSAPLDRHQIRVYTYTMNTKFVCTCTTVRHAAQTLTEVYDRVLAPSGLKITQYMLLRRSVACSCLLCIIPPNRGTIQIPVHGRWRIAAGTEAPEEFPNVFFCPLTMCVLHTP